MRSGGARVASAALRLRGHDAVLVIDNRPVVIFRTAAGLSVIVRIRYITPDRPAATHLASAGPGTAGARSELKR
jgi:hypothetical protein